MRFIKDLSDWEHQELERLIKESSSYRERMRAQAILLSYKGYSLIELSELFSVDRDTISAWFNRFAKHRTTKLQDAPGRGRHSKLTSSEKKT